MFDLVLMVATTVASGVDLNAIWDMLMNTGVFAVMFGWLFWDTRKEAKNREDRLMNHIEKQEEALDKVTDTIERMDIRLSNIEDKVKDK